MFPIQWSLTNTVLLSAVNVMLSAVMKNNWLLFLLSQTEKQTLGFWLYITQQVLASWMDFMF